MTSAAALGVRDKCTTGCSILDSSLGGGFVSGIVTELVGESGAAKTQLALQLLVTTQLPLDQGGLAGAAFYMHTEGYFAFRRLHQIANAFARSRNLGFDPCCNVLVEPVESIQELFAVLDRLELLLVSQRQPEQQQQKPEQQQQQQQGMRVRTLVIDSVAALFRSEFDNNRAEMTMRAGALFQLGAKLKALAHRHDLVIVVTNQVMDCVGDSNAVQIGNLSELESSGRKVAPTLGLSWSHCINTRIFLSRSTEYYRCPEPVLKRQRSTSPEPSEVRTRTRRTLQVVFAPHLPYAACEFVVTEDGIKSAHGQELLRYRAVQELF